MPPLKHATHDTLVVFVRLKHLPALVWLEFHAKGHHQWVLQVLPPLPMMMTQPPQPLVLLLKGVDTVQARLVIG